MGKVLILWAACLGLAACNTTQGLKQDVAVGAEKTSEALHKGGEAVGHALQKTGEAVGGALKKGGEAIEKAAK